jgi:hypothetical protein
MSLTATFSVTTFNCWWICGLLYAWRGAFLDEDIRNAFCLGLGESGPGSSEVRSINE